MYFEAARSDIYTRVRFKKQKNLQTTFDGCSFIKRQPNVSQAGLQYQRTLKIN